MVVHIRKKSSRQHGSRTHGWGYKKHRGAGNRGGRGMAGTGKRADSKKPSIWKQPYFGQRGFFNPNPKKNKNIIAISLKNVEDRLDGWKGAGFVKEEDGKVVVDLGKLGYNKLLSSSMATKKLKISVLYASKGAVKRVERAGGEVLTSKKEEKLQEV